MILHIPHSSTYFPDFDGFILDKSEIIREVNLLTDWFTSELFPSAIYPSVILPVSRIYCDMGRFENDAEEPMAKLGMGVLYAKTDRGAELRNVTDTF